MGENPKALRDLFISSYAMKSTATGFALNNILGSENVQRELNTAPPTNCPFSRLRIVNICDPFNSGIAQTSAAAIDALAGDFRKRSLFDIFQMLALPRAAQTPSPSISVITGRFIQKSTVKNSGTGR